MKTLKEIREFCRSLYFVDDINGNEEKWQPFRNYSTEQVEEYIENDIGSLCSFLNVRYEKPVSKKFRVWYQSVNYYYLDVEAKDETEAEEKAKKADGDEFSEKQGFEGVGSWDYDRVENMEQS